MAAGCYMINCNVLDMPECHTHVKSIGSTFRRPRCSTLPFNSLNFKPLKVLYRCELPQGMLKPHSNLFSRLAKKRRMHRLHKPAYTCTPRTHRIKEYCVMDLHHSTPIQNSINFRQILNWQSEKWACASTFPTL